MKDRSKEVPSKVEVLGEYDGSIVCSRHIKFSVHDTCVGSRYIPNEYALLLLDKKMGAEAWRLYSTIEGFLNDSSLKILLALACREGLEKAWEYVMQFKTEKPNGKPRFYFGRDIHYGVFKSCQYELDLIDGQVGFRFGVSGLKQSFNEDELPLNSYLETEEVGYVLDSEEYLKATSCIEEFFKFVTRLMQAKDHLLQSRVDKVLAAFFKSKVQGYALLKEAFRDYEDRKYRDNFISQLHNRGAIKYPAGFLAFSWPHYYFVTGGGEVSKISYRDNCATETAIAKAFQRGIAPKKILAFKEEEVMPRTLEEIAQKVGRLEPTLVLVIHP